jgi:CRISPR/Cas system CSM-associated protein Csm4 (group 5 of RAMP superfamily)
MPSVLVRLRPTGPWRIGPDSGDRDRVDRIYHSDALYSAVSAAMARLGDLPEWLDATARSAAPAVRFSSCFPFQGDLLYVVPPRHVWPPPASSKVRWKGARNHPRRQAPERGRLGR